MEELKETQTSQEKTKYSAKYLVVDLSGGEKAEMYPVRGTNADPWERKQVCRTTELWLRRIPGGVVHMGPLQYGWRQPQCVTLQDYYLGILQCTWEQCDQVMGLNWEKGYELIRGRGVTNAFIRGNDCTIWDPVSPTSFLGRLRAKTGLPFELPTDAQVEYACRLQADGVTVETVEQRAPSGDDPEDPRTGLGLLDMRGNDRWEWCLPVDAPKTRPVMKIPPFLFLSNLIDKLFNKTIAHDPSADDYHVGNCGNWNNYNRVFGYFHGVFAQREYEDRMHNLAFRVCLPTTPEGDSLRPGAPYEG